MAKVSFNSAVTAIHGMIDNWVYRRNGDGFVIARRPVNLAPPTAGQLAFREQFRAATEYAKAALAVADLRLRYLLAAKARGLSAYAVAVGDFLKPPVVTAIDLAGYHGQAGDPLVVHATAGLELTGVHVTIRNAANAILEQGAATLTDGQWRYLATTAVANGTAVTIEAVATDHPGHTGELSVPLVVG